MFETKKLKTKKRRKTVGRGPGSGHGKTSTRGQKGQKSRSGGKSGPYLGFEGGQMPLYRRVPKRGFKSRNRLEITVINLDVLSKACNAGETVTLEMLKEKRLIKSLTDCVKILGRGEAELDKALHIKVHKISKSAKAKIEALGGTFESV